MGPASDLGAAKHGIVRAEQVGVGFKNAEKLWKRRIALRKPPPMVPIGHGGMDVNGRNSCA
jgi:hypothetical protein